MATLTIPNSFNAFTKIQSSQVNANFAAVATLINSTGLDNANIASGAAIAYSKLNLTGSIVNADVNAAAAVAYSKLNLTGSILNADINAAAAIAYSKLNLSGSILNADVNAAAAIAYSKLNLASSIVNADVSGSAAIAYSKLNLSGSIVNADVSGSAAIAYSKLNLATSIVNADISASAAIARSKVATGTASHVLINDGSGNFSSEAQLAISRGGTNATTATTAFTNLSPMTTKGDLITYSSSAARIGVGSDGQVLTADSAQTTGLKWSSLPGNPSFSEELYNVGLATSVAANAMTVSLKQADGSSDPSAGNPCKMAFRSPTGTSGAYNERSVTAATSLVIPSGGTIGTASGINQYIWIYALDNAGTVELAVSGSLYEDGTVQSTTAISGSSTSSTTIYSTTARTNVPIRLIGRLGNNQSSAGVYAANAINLTVLPFTISLFTPKQVTLSATATNWAITRGVGCFYQTLDQAWRFRFNIVGGFSGAADASSFALNIGNVVFKSTSNYDQAVAVYDQGAFGRGTYVTACANQGASTITVTAGSTITRNNFWGLSGDVELNSKPGFAEF